MEKFEDLLPEARAAILRVSGEANPFSLLGNERSPFHDEVAKATGLDPEIKRKDVVFLTGTALASLAVEYRPVNESEQESSAD